MKFRPAGTAGQLVAWLVLCILAAHLASVLALQSSAELLNPVSRDQVLERLAIAYRAIDIADDEAAMLDAMGSDGARFWIDVRAPAARGDASAEEQRVRARLRQKLPQVAANGTWVALKPPRHGLFFGGFDTRLGWSTLPLEMAVELPDGRWLHSVQQPLAGYQWWRLLRFSLPTSSLPVLCIVLFFIFRTLRPIRALARAAERFSRGERVPPLPLVGPREAREVSAAFNLMQDKLTRFIDDRTRLLAAVSHDFRTPITSLMLRAEFIEDPVQRAAIRRTLEDMRAMVEQTLRFTQDDAAVEVTCGIDLRDLLHGVAAQHAALGRDVRLEPGPALAYRARPVSLKRAVGNLVDNAVKHGAFARIRLVAGAAPAQGVRIEIDDGGPGLDAALRERVFEPFFQLDRARGRAAGGVGLGLSIARSCVRAHGGDVRLENLPGGGLRATILLPGAERHAP